MVTVYYRPQEDHIKPRSIVASGSTDSETEALASSKPSLAKAIRTTESKFKTSKYEAETIEDTLFENRSTLKQMIANIAMHMSSEVRLDLFRQLDELLDIESFEEDDTLINPDSFATFLNPFTLITGLKLPSLTVTRNGNLSATWLSEGGRITIEFLQKGMLKTIATRSQAGDTEYIAHQGSTRSFQNFVAQNNLKTWCINAPPKNIENT